MESTETEMDRTVNRGAGAFEKSSHRNILLVGCAQTVTSFLMFDYLL